MLQKLLQFLGGRATDGGTGELNEWIIATTVFGRPQEFDAATDTTVRTSVYRLRSKLREYFAQEGKSDPVIIEIPKGHHLPVFLKRESTEDSMPATVADSLDSLVVSTTSGKTRLWPRFAAMIALLAVGVIGGRSWALHPVAKSAQAGTSAGRAAAFWRVFAGGRPVIVAYSNAELLQTDTRDLVHFDKGAVDDRGAIVDPSLAARSVPNPEILRGHRVFYEDGYTGTGEVQAVYILTRLLTRLGIDIEVKRVRLLTSDDFKGHSVVLLGSSLENRAIDDLHLRQGFTFQLALNSMWAGGIVDSKASGQGKQSAYNIERDPVTQALQLDYAIASVQAGVAADTRIMVLGGLTTSGTQGAAEFVTSDATVGDLLTKLHWKQPLADSLPSFESVLQVRVVRGLDPVSFKCVTARLSPSS
jgi:hypothetical protein